jgi:hypothetical protein
MKVLSGGEDALGAVMLQMSVDMGIFIANSGSDKMPCSEPVHTPTSVSGTPTHTIYCTYERS